MSLMTIEPARLTIADLEILEAQHSNAIVPVPPAPPEKRLPPMTKRDLRQQFVGIARMINHLSGGDMRDQIDNLDFMVRHINLLEEQLAEAQRENALLKQARAAELVGYKKALRNISVVLDGHVDPFEVKPASKWNKTDLSKWVLAVVESMKWARQRADNILDPQNAVAIAPDPE